MSKPNHFIIIGRTSPAIAEEIVSQFGNGAINEQGPVIFQPGNVFQARFGTFGDGESIFELFIDGKRSDHPIEQHLTEDHKQEIADALKGAHVTIVHSISGDNTSSRANSLLDGVYDLKNQYGVSSITVIAPHLPYMRNDRRFRVIGPDGKEAFQRNAIASENYARRLRSEGADFVVGIEPHSRDGVEHYRRHFGERNVEFLKTGDFYARDFAAEHAIVDLQGEWKIAVGSPDGLNKPNDYGIARAKSFAKALYKGTPIGDINYNKDVRQIGCMFAIHKDRLGEKETIIREFSGNVAGKHAVLIDDIFSSGGTTIEAATALKQHGAVHVTAIATHAVLVNSALTRLLESPFIDEMRMTDTIPSSFEKAGQFLSQSHPKLVVKTVAPLIAAQIQKDHKIRFRCAWKYETGLQPTVLHSPVPTPQVG